MPSKFDPLWPQSITCMFQPCKMLTDAFLLAERIAEICDEYPSLGTGLGMLNLCQVDTDGEIKWAASFDVTCTDHSEWYEKEEMADCLQYAARAKTPQRAITLAAEKALPVLLEVMK